MKFPGSNQTFMKLGGPWTPYWGRGEAPSYFKKYFKGITLMICAKSRLTIRIGSNVTVVGGGGHSYGTTGINATFKSSRNGCPLLGTFSMISPGLLVVQRSLCRGSLFLGCSRDLKVLKIL